MKCKMNYSYLLYRLIKLKEIDDSGFELDIYPKDFFVLFVTLDATKTDN